MGLLRYQPRSTRSRDVANICRCFSLICLLSQIPYSYAMEPYYAVPSRGLAAVMSVKPHASRAALTRLLLLLILACCRYDERLRRWGGDKQTHAYELAAKSFEFFVVALAGIVHQPHERVKSWSQDKGIKCADGRFCAAGTVF